MCYRNLKMNFFFYEIYIFFLKVKKNIKVLSVGKIFIEI